MPTNSETETYICQWTISNYKREKSDNVDEANFRHEQRSEQTEIDEIAQIPQVSGLQSVDATQLASFQFPYQDNCKSQTLAL